MAVDWMTALLCLSIGLTSVGWAAAANGVRRRRGLGSFRWRGLDAAQRWRVIVPHWFLAKSLFLLWFGSVVTWRLVTGFTVGSADAARYLLLGIVAYFLVAKVLAFWVWRQLPEREDDAENEGQALTRDVRREAERWMEGA